MRSRGGSFALGAFLVFSLGMVSSQRGWWPATIYADAYSAWQAQKERARLIASRGGALNRNSNALAASGRVRSDSDAQHYEGFTFICKDDYTPILVDMRGTPVYQWQVPFSKAWPNPPPVTNPVPAIATYSVSAHVYPNGDVVEVLQGVGDTPYGYGLIKMDMHSRVLWTYSKNVHHDVHVASDGRIYTLIQSFHKKVLPGLEFYHYPILADSVVVLSPNGDEELRILIIAAFLDTPYQSMLPELFEQRFKGHERKFDITHANSAMPLEPKLASKFPQFKAGDILLSLKNMDMIAVLNPQTRKIIWAMRGPWEDQHQARFLPNGNIMVFDNEGLIISEKRRNSRMLEVNPVTQEIVWEYDGNKNNIIYTEDKGGYDLLPGGNVLLFSTNQGIISEVAPGGKEIWRYKLTVPIPAAERWAPSYFTDEFCIKIGCKNNE